MLVKNDALESKMSFLECLFPRDMWERFEIKYAKKPGSEKVSPDTKSQDTKLQDFKLLEDIYPKENMVNVDPMYWKKIIHDCMWAGHCGSKEHPADELRSCSGLFVPTPPAPIMKSPVAPIKMENHHKPFSNGQQSLLKSHFRASAVMQTPPMSDDEEMKANPTNVLKLLNEAIEECDLEEDSDLCDYFEDTDIKDEVDIKDFEDDEEEDEQPDITTVIDPVKTFHAAESDHSYHKGKCSSMAFAPFGINTPSDSDEEIDVVNVIDKFQFNNKSVLSFPNNPSTRDRQQIQRRMATAISKKRIAPQGLKTIMPVRKMSPPETPVIKKKSATTTTRGGKRMKQCRPPTNSSYKRRHYGHSSDDELEPSEKRSLHNNMERQRRIDLRNAFEDLRVLVPEVSKKERAAKVVILREAASYCDFLTNTSKNYSKHFDDLKKKQEFLRRRVSQLRRNLAAKR